MLMEADVAGLIGAGRFECGGERLNYRNGFRDRHLVRGRRRQRSSVLRYATRSAICAWLSWNSSMTG